MNNRYTSSFIKQWSVFVISSKWPTTHSRILRRHWRRH